MDDNRIIELLFARSEQALEEISEKYGALCRKIAQNILCDREDEEECVNDAYLGVWNSIPPRRPESLCAYISRVVRNCAVSRYRANIAKKRNSCYNVALCEIADFVRSDESIDEDLSVKELTEHINVFLASLDTESRVAFVRRYYCFDSVEDIAKLLNKKSHYVTVKLSRVREKLRVYLIEKGVEI